MTDFSKTGLHNLVVNELHMEVMEEFKLPVGCSTRLFLPEPSFLTFAFLLSRIMRTFI